MKKAIVVEHDDKSGFRTSWSKPIRQDVPEDEKTPQWFFRNLNYCLSFYNKPVGSIKFDAVPSDRSTTGIPESDRLYPVQHMLRMMMYYLGKQPNLDYAYLTQNVKDVNMQAQWYKGQDVAEFVNYFRGLMIQRLSQAKKDKMWSAHPVGKEVSNRYTQMYDKLELALALKPILENIAEEDGLEFNPMPGTSIQQPEDIDAAMETSFIEQSSITATDMANGIWFTHGWNHKALMSFMHTVIAGQTAWWHRVLNGRQVQDILQPYQVIRDNRFDHDYGKYDEFIGAIQSLSILEAQRRHPHLTSSQVDDIHNIAADGEKQKLYNTTSNINWYAVTESGEHRVTEVTMYWRTRRQSNKILVKNRFGEPVARVRKGVKEDEIKNITNDFGLNDIAYCTILGNKYIVDWGYVDNLVESIEDPSIPEFPIRFFRPNTFLGDSVSEVSRIHRIQDEMDMLDFKIREMVGRAKGKVHIIHGDKLGDMTTIKDLVDDFADMGIHVSQGSGEANDPADRKSMVEVVDMTLDPNIYRIAELYKERKERMGRVLNTSSISLGQQTRYIGLGQQQSTISQNQLGVSYLMDGFLDFIVMNMRYSVNQAKMLYRDKEVEFLVGEKGIRFINFTGDIPFERFMTSLNLSDVIDEDARKRILAYAQAWSQNPAFNVSASAIIQIEKANSFTEAADMLDRDRKKNEAKAQRSAKEMEEMKSKMSQMQQAIAMMMEQFKQDNENYRVEIKEAMKLLPQLAKEPMPPAPIQQQMAQMMQGGNQQQEQQQPQEIPQ